MHVRRTKNLIHVLFRNIRATFASFAPDNSFTLIEPCLPCLPAGRRQGRSSFTLIELLIVIGILAILVAAVVIALNPAQLLAQARDGKRQQDLLALTQALNTIYALDQSVSFGSSSVVYTSLPDSTTTCANWHLPSLPSGWIYNCVSTSSLQSATGTGWIPVNFTTTGVVSLASLPLDPINTSSTGLYYTYVTGGSYELTASFESTKYKLGGGNDQVSTDGGSYPDLYEVGSNLSLQPLDHGDPSLVGYWPLNEGTGTIAYDRSGNGNNGTWNGTSTPHYATSNGKTIGYFNGVNDYINTTNPLNFGIMGFSFVAWFKGGSQLTTYPLILGLWALSNHPRAALGLYSSDGSLRNVVVDSNNIDGTRYGPGILDGKWHNLVLTVAKNSVSNYIDGVLVSGGVTSFTGDFNFGSSVQIGTLANYYYVGALDDVYVYNRALSASEVSALYNAAR